MVGGGVHMRTKILLALLEKGWVIVEREGRSLNED